MGVTFSAVSFSHMYITTKFHKAHCLHLSKAGIFFWCQRDPPTTLWISSHCSPNSNRYWQFPYGTSHIPLWTHTQYMAGMFNAFGSPFREYLYPNSYSPNKAHLPWFSLWYILFQKGYKGTLFLFSFSAKSTPPILTLSLCFLSVKDIQNFQRFQKSFQ